MSLSTQPFQQAFLYINNFIVSRTGATTLSVTAGQCRDYTNSVDILNTDEATTITASVNGVNGLDTGTFAASTPYFIHAIGSSLNTVQPAFLLSKSGSEPVLPEGGYDCFRVIGMWFTDGAVHFHTGKYAGNANSRTYFYGNIIQVQDNGTSATLAAVDLSSVVPAIDNTMVRIQDAFTPATAGDYVSYFDGSSVLTVGPSTYGSVAAKVNGGEHTILSTLVSGVPKIQYINSAASCNVDIWVSGFTLYL